MHGCRAELEDLLSKVGFGTGDKLYLVGDLVARGPESAEVISLAMRLGAVSVRGNHEERILNWRSSQQLGLATERLSEVHRRVVESLEDDQWQYLERTPLWFDVAEHDIRMVHAGVLPGLAIERQAKSTLLTIRSLSESGQAQERAGGTLWGSRYRGAPHLVFGHFARPEPQLHPDATGLDTSCVYGGELTAMVLDAGARVPPPADRRDVLVSVSARRAWFPGTRGSR